MLNMYGLVPPHRTALHLPLEKISMSTRPEGQNPEAVVQSRLASPRSSPTLLYVGGRSACRSSPPPGFQRRALAGWLAGWPAAAREARDETG